MGYTSLLKRIGTNLDSIKTALESQLPSGATFIQASADGAAGAAVTVSLPAVPGKTNYVLGYFVNVDIAQLTNITTIILKDDTTVKGTRVLNAAGPVGSEIAITSNSGPILIGTISKAINLVVSAPGGTTVMHTCIWGYYL